MGVPAEGAVSLRDRMAPSWDQLRRVPWYGWACGYFVLATVVLTWPLVLRMQDALVGRIGDNLLIVWLIGWAQKSLFSLHQSPYFTSLVNFPEGWRPATTETTPAMVLTGLPFSLLGGPVLGYNMSLLLSFVSSGLIVCWWVYRMTGRLAAGLIAGTLFAFSSYRVAHFISGHLNLLGTQFLALYFMSLYETLESPAKSRVWVAVGGVSLGLVAWTSQYYLYMTLVLTALAVPLHGVVRGPRFVLRRSYVLQLLSIVMVSMPLLILAEYPYFEAASAGSLPIRDVASAVRNSAGLADYLLPTTWNDFLGPFVSEHFDRSYWIESSLYLGIATCTMALLAIVVPGAKVGSRATRLHMGLLAASALLLSLGPALRCFSGDLDPRLPPALGWVLDACDVSIPSPGVLLYRFLPFYTSVRVPARYGVYVILFVCVLAGLGIAYLQKRLPGSMRAVAVALIIAIVAFDLEPWRPRFSTLEGRDVDYWLATQPGEGAVVELPIGGQDTRLYAYYGLIHGKPIFGGQNIYPYALDEEINAALSEFPEQEDIDLLRSEGAEYLVVDSRLYDQIDALDDIEEALAGLGVPRVAIIGDHQVYELAP
jgi:hypothetical protein